MIEGRYASFFSYRVPVRPLVPKNAIASGDVSIRFAWVFGWHREVNCACLLVEGALLGVGRKRSQKDGRHSAGSPRIKKLFDTPKGSRRTSPGLKLLKCSGLSSDVAMGQHPQTPLVNIKK